MTPKTLKALLEIEKELRFEAQNRGDLARIRLHEWADRLAKIILSDETVS